MSCEFHFHYDYYKEFPGIFTININNKANKFPFQSYLLKSSRIFMQTSRDYFNFGPLIISIGFIFNFRKKHKQIDAWFCCSRLMIMFDFSGEIRSDPYNMYSGNSDFRYGVRMDLRGVMVPLPDR